MCVCACVCVWGRSQLGEVMRSRGPSAEALEAQAAKQAPNECCAYIYTSGTTGNPKVG